MKIAHIRNGSIAVVAMLCLVCGTASADVYVVTKTNDEAGPCNSDVDCSLREAITAANLRAGADTIELPGGIGIYLLDFTGADEDFNATGIPTEQEFIAEYCKHTGRDEIENWHFYLIYNMFRSATIIRGYTSAAWQRQLGKSIGVSISGFLEKIVQFYFGNI